jgi:hypothetical protein
MCLQALERGGGDHRLTLDQLPLDGREDFLRRHVHPGHDREATEDKAIGRDQLHERPRVGEVRHHPATRVVVEHRYGAGGFHREEARIPLRLEVALPSRLLVVHSHHEGILEIQGDGVELPEDDLVGVQDLVGQRRARVHVDPAAQLPTLVEPVAFHEQRRVQTPQVEGHERSPDRLLLERRREDGRHHEIDQGAVPIDDRAVRDGIEEFGGRRQPITNDRPDGTACFGIVLPVPRELTQRELAAKREVARLEQRLHVGLGRVVAHCCNLRRLVTPRSL